MKSSLMKLFGWSITVMFSFFEVGLIEFSSLFISACARLNPGIPPPFFLFRVNFLFNF